MKNLGTLILAFACITAVNAQRNKKIKGNGNVVTIERNTSDYDGIRVGGFFEVHLVEGNEGKITLKGDDNLLEYIETDVKGRSLTIKSKDNMNLRPSEKVLITVAVESIDYLRLSGSGKVIGEKTLDTENFKIRTSGSRNLDLALDSENLSITTSGSSRINLRGNSVDLEVTSSGSSIINAYELEVEDAKIVLSGSSKVRVMVNKDIDARVSGSGNIRYKGNPEKVNTKTSGSGSVSKG